MEQSVEFLFTLGCVSDIEWLWGY